MPMDPNVLSFLNGTLTSPNIDMSNMVQVSATNQLLLDVSSYTVLSNGFVAFNGLMIAAGDGNQHGIAVPDKSWFVWRETISGAFVCMYYVDSSQGMTSPNVAFDALLSVGEIGPPPKPNADMVVPANSPRVAVGAGLVNGGYLVRYQYWAATDGSYCLPDGDTRNVAVTTSHGVQQTSSTQQTVAQSISASTSAGWGPVSASLSYSMDTTSSWSSSYEVTDETTRNDTVTLTNNSGKTVYYLAWQLMDVIQVYLTVNSQSVPSASIITACSPRIYDGPYDPASLPPNPRPTAKLTPAERVAVSTWSRVRPVLPRLPGE